MLEVSMTEILITGGAGNFGRSLAYALKDKDVSLRILDLPTCDFSFCENWPNAQVIPGNILQPGSLKDALVGVDLIYHLAAILPPASEQNRELTFQVNVEGTQNLVDACKSYGQISNLLFASSVSVFGNTSHEKKLIKPEHAVNPFDWYAQSKVAAEHILMTSGLPYVNLRISGIVIPAFLDPPEPWAFMSDQRIELLTLGDLIRALVNLEGLAEAKGQTLLLAGGSSWQVTGEEYVRRWGEIMEIPLEDMSFMDQPGWLNWYDTSKSQALLDYQHTSLDAFYGELNDAVQEALA
jgi:nucleoside-diphosphate-sugar epimerase